MIQIFRKCSFEQKRKRIYSKNAQKYMDITGKYVVDT